MVISTRNFIRSTSGAAGLALANLIFSNTLNSHIPGTVPLDIVAQIESSIFGVHDVSGLSSAEQDVILDAYMKAARSVCILWAVAIALCLLLMVMIKDKGLKRQEEEKHSPSRDVPVELENSGSPSSRH